MDMLIIGGILILAVVAFVCRIEFLATGVLIPFSRMLQKFADKTKIFRPFSRVAKWAQKLDSCVVRKVFQSKPNPKLAPFGGMSQVIKMAFCLLFSVAVALGMVLFGGKSAGDVEVELLTSFPVFAILNMLVSSGFSYEALVQMSLFSILSIGFIRKNTEKNMLIRVTYDLIFTVFCTCLLYVIPDAVYGLPLQAMPFLRWLMRVFIDVPVVNILMVLLGTALAIGVLYVIAATYIRAFLDLVAAVAYALFPFTILVAVVLLINALNWPRAVTTALYYALVLGVTYWQELQRLADE